LQWRNSLATDGKSADTADFDDELDTDESGVSAKSADFIGYAKKFADVSRSFDSAALSFDSASNAFQELQAN